MKTKTKQWTRWSLAIGLAILAGGLLTTLGRSSLYAQSSAARTAGKDSVFVVSAVAAGMALNAANGSAMGSEPVL